MRIFSVFVLLLSLSACVTTVTSPFSKNISLEKEVEARVQVALGYLQHGQPEMAIYHMKEIMAKQPKSARIHEVLALALWESSELEDADKHFRKMVKYDEGYSRGRMNYASFLMVQEELEPSLEQLEVVVKDIYHPNRAQAFYMMAAIYRQQGETEKMVTAYERTLKLDKRFVPALLELSEYRYQKEEFSDSYQLHKRYREQVQQSSAKGLLLGIKLARKFNDRSEEASYVLALKNLYPKSQEYLDYLELSKN